MTDVARYDPSEYIGRRVAVLGAGGFVGRWVARAVARTGAETSGGGTDADTGGHMQGSRRTGNGTTTPRGPEQLFANSYNFNNSNSSTCR